MRKLCTMALTLALICVPVTALAAPAHDYDTTLVAATVAPDASRDQQEAPALAGRRGDTPAIYPAFDADNSSVFLIDRRAPRYVDPG